MTAPVWTVRLDEATTRLLRRYRGQKPADVVARAVRLLAQADGLLDASGKPTTDRAQRRQT
jgi:tellurite resistance protein